MAADNLESPLNERGPFRDPLYVDSSRHDEPDQQNASVISLEIAWYGTTPISAAGVLLNILVLVVWRQKAKFQPIVWLFKVLAVFDLIFIILFNSWWFTKHYKPKAASVLSAVAFASQYLLINISMLICIWRWIAVFRNEQSQKLLTKARAMLAVGIIFSYCVIAKLFERLLLNYQDGKDAKNLISLTITHIMLSVPVLVQAVLTTSLLWGLCHAHKVKPQLSSTGYVHRRIRSNNAASKARRLTYTLISITVSSFVAYMLGNGVDTCYVFSSEPDRKAMRVAFAATNLLFIVHSSLPFVFYFLFMYKFRKLCLLKFITVSTGFYSQQAGSDTEHSEINDIAGFKYQSTYRHSNVTIDVDGVMTISRAQNYEESRSGIARRDSPVGQRHSHAASKVSSL